MWLLGRLLPWWLVSGHLKVKHGDGKQEVVSVGFLSVDSVTCPRVTSDSHLSIWLNQSESSCFDLVFYFASVLFNRTGCSGHASIHHLLKQATGHF